MESETRWKTPQSFLNLKIFKISLNSECELLCKFSRSITFKTETFFREFHTWRTFYVHQMWFSSIKKISNVSFAYVEHASCIFDSFWKIFCLFATHKTWIFRSIKSCWQWKILSWNGSREKRSHFEEQGKKKFLNAMHFLNGSCR